jgi:hypothetical protein
MSDDYLDKFLGAEEESGGEPKHKLPSWVSETNSSKAAYEAVLKLYEEKKRYIRNHIKKAAYTKKSVYQISKSEVAREADVKMQAIFHSVNYANDLKKLFNEKNELLLEAKEKAIAKRYTGNQAKPKGEVVDLLQQSEAEIIRLKARIVEDVYEMGLKRMPLDVRRKLKLL